MWDFLTFNTFISKNILTFAYYVGVITMPLVAWFLKIYLLEKSLTLKKINENKVVAIVGFLIIFICAQICLRMMFETMIGYFDMREYLYEISKNG